MTLLQCESWTKILPTCTSFETAYIEQINDNFDELTAFNNASCSLGKLRAS